MFRTLTECFAKCGDGSGLCLDRQVLFTLLKINYTFQVWAGGFASPFVFFPPDWQISEIIPPWQANLPRLFEKEQLVVS